MEQNAKNSAAAMTAKTADLRPALRGMTLEEMTAHLAKGKFPAFRAKQLYQWVYRHAALSLDEMKNLPKDMRQYLADTTTFGGVEVLKVDGPPEKTQKAAWKLADGSVIESVVMRDEGKERTSLCVSSQVGCAVGCTFCLTGYGGFQRQLTADEIVGQVLAIRRNLLEKDEPIHTIVFMGMGEPMFNLAPVIKAIRLLTDSEGVSISPRRITVSTSGVIPGIQDFGGANTGAMLAVSLNATTDEVRTSIMPLNKRWPIRDLIQALKQFPIKPRQRITIEYVLLKGINDTPEDAVRLTKILRAIPCKVNLIMFNPHELLHYEPVSDETLKMFLKTLSDADYSVSVRWSKGREIEAACGQLAAHYFQRQTA